MADGLLPINFVVNRKLLCLSEANPRQVLLPNFFQEDILPIRFKGLLYEQDSPPFMKKLNLMGYALQVSVGLAGSIKANNVTWDLVDGGYALEGELNLNTSDINNALGSNESVVLTFEIILSTAELKYRMTQSVLVKKSVALVGGLVPPPTDTALGRLEAQRIYAPLENCMGIVFKDAVTGERWSLRIANGAPVIDPVA